MKCYHCGTKLKKGATQCPTCGVYVNPGQAAEASSSRQKAVLITLICISSVVAAALIVFAVFLVQNMIRNQNYIKKLTLYKEVLVHIQDESHFDPGENDRDLFAFCDVGEEDVPSMFYVAQKQDEEGSQFPVIRMYDIIDNEAQVIYESHIDDGTVDFLCILQDEDTGSLYLFSDYERPETGSAAIFSLRKENSEIRQEEKYRMRYQWQTENDENAYRYEYYINTQNVDEDTFNTELSDFVDSIDRVIVSGGTGARALKFNYFIDIASVAMSYEDAIEYLDNGISSGDRDSATPDQATPDEASKKTREVTIVDPSDIPESLAQFLQFYDFAGTGEFDCSNPDYGSKNMVRYIAGNPSCVENSLYPGGEVKEIWQNGSDPLKKFNNAGTLEYPKKKLMWIMQNVFNINAIDAQQLLQSDLDSDPDFYEYEKDGEMYLYRKIGGVGGPGFAVSYREILYDGEKYYIVYDCVDSYYSRKYSTYAKTYYAVFSEKEYDGQKYWSLFKHSEEISELPKAETALSDTDIFSKFEGEYLFSSGIGGWGTFMTINDDGTFSGEYSDSNMGESGDGYDSTVYYAKFSGRFQNPQRINAYTYSFELGDIAYENEPGTEEIKKIENSDHRLRTVYSEAYGLKESATIYAYLPDAPVVLLPDGLLTWTLYNRSSDTEYSPKMSYRCLFIETDTEYGMGWMERKQTN